MSLRFKIAVAFWFAVSAGVLFADAVPQQARGMYAAAAAWAEDGDSDDDSPQNPPPQPQYDVAEGDAAGQGDAGADTDDAGPKPPEGVRRRRPQTAEEERAYKMRKTREDPFLSPGGPDAAIDLPAPYNPQNYIAPLQQGYSAKYMIQDAGGRPLGQLLLSVELRSVVSANDTAIATALYGNAPQAQVRLWLDARTMAPQRLERRMLGRGEAELVPEPAAADSPPPEAVASGTTPGDAPPQIAVAAPGPATAWEPGQEPMRLNAEYLFDRVSIRHSTGVISVSREIRQLPSSFELESLPILVRQLDCRYADWPFEAAVTDARHFRSLPLSIEEPGWLEVLSAEPQQYRCREVILRLGAQSYKYYVQSTAPYKLVRFTDGVYTYTLFEYASR